MFSKHKFNVYVLTYVTKLYRAFNWSKYKIWNLKEKGKIISCFEILNLDGKRLFKIPNWQEYKVYKYGYNDYGETLGIGYDVSWFNIWN